MKRMKVLRTALGLKQSDLALKLKTTQQTIARWESGKAEPPIAALRDLALVLGTSVDDLLGRSGINEKPQSNSYYLLAPGLDGFWGHLGILLPGAEHSKWYPITEGEYDRAWDALRSFEAPDWLVIQTLNNRVLALAPKRVKRIMLLDDACDELKDDWEWKEPLGAYQGLSLEVYRAMSAWALDGMGDSSAFKEEYSETLRALAMEHITDAGLIKEDEAVFRILHHATIHFRDGASRSHAVEPTAVVDAVLEIESGAHIAYLPAAGGDFEGFYPLDELVLIELPLLDYEEGARDRRAGSHGEGVANDS